ncbi:MAG TPA: FAD-binding and (Fe-S)-binding domain-containing protein [Verrucomicrobiae bacterium]|nr:FAD-binding and (Fe-S)-binding domain-containing protein [Verrucomicrobiae bacterium]
MLAETIAKDQRRVSTAKPEQRSDVNTARLEAVLKRKIKGEVRFDVGSRALYATDGSNYRQVPIGVVIPRDEEDVQETVAACHQFEAPVLCRGGGTSLAGQCCNVAVILDFTKHLNRILEIDPTRKLARVQPGCVLDELRHAASKQHKLTFGPDPATHSHCAIGGMLGNNSCGTHSLLAGKHGFGLRTSDNTHELDVLTYDGARMRVGETSPEELERIIRRGGAQGKIYRQLRDLRDEYQEQLRHHFPKLPRRVSGYNIDELLPEHHFNVARSLVGSEGTLVTILQATLHLVPDPQAKTLLVFGYPDIYSAADHLMEILELQPIGLEGIDETLIQWMKLKKTHTSNLKFLPEGKGWLFVLFGGDSKQDTDAQARRCMAKLEHVKNPPSARLFDEPEEEEKLWKIRESGLAATAWVPNHPDNWPGFEDSAVPVPAVGPYLRELRKLMDKYQYTASLYGHLGQGCIHCRIPFDLYTADGIKAWKNFMEEATDLVVRYGGSMSGEHGDGQARAPYIHKMFGPELMRAFRQFKRIWDPHWKMNPGKLIDAYPVDANLRIGTDYSPPNPKTHFSYPEDHWTFARAALRCVGVGDCRKKGGQTMCPSYQVTLEEEHCTRGRARLLWEMLNGRELKDGWKSEAVKHSLDLCLSCKGCKSDCPVNVDMATYKAEFLSHYYEGRLRPRHAYAFGLVHIWSRLAGVAPTLVNLFTQTPVLRAFAKWGAGMAPQRSIPLFAPQSFKEWFRARRPQNRQAPPVLLFADTFNNYFHTSVAKAAVEVLENAGFRAVVPMQDMCCGRPLYDYGMLTQAKSWLADILCKLRPQIEAGTPMVVLEPSCCAVFRDELTNIYPNNADAKRLHERTFTLAEFLRRYAPDYPVPQLHRHALVHGHCHHKAVMGIQAEQEVLKAMGLDFKVLDSGCCGMAGSFGFEKGDPYEVSIKCGERVLLPEVRNAVSEDLIIADGFSCKTQIEQGTDRRALHLAQVLQLALREGSQGPQGQRPEERFERERQAEFRAAHIRTAAKLGGVAVAGLLACALLRRWSKSARA